MTDFPLTFALTSLAVFVGYLALCLVVQRKVLAAIAECSELDNRTRFWGHLFITLTVEHLEEYAWEFAWRQTMTMTDNRAQLQDLLRKVLAPRRAERWVDYWGSRKRKAAQDEAAESGAPVSPAEPKESSTRLMPIDGSALKRKRGRPRKEAVPVELETPALPRQKRAYRRRVVTGPAAPAELVADSALPSQPSTSA